MVEICVKYLNIFEIWTLCKIRSGNDWSYSTGCFYVIVWIVAECYLKWVYIMHEHISIICNTNKLI